MQTNNIIELKIRDVDFTFDGYYIRAKDEVRYKRIKNNYTYLYSIKSKEDNIKFNKVWINNIKFSKHEKELIKTFLEQCLIMIL